MGSRVPSRMNTYLSETYSCSYSQANSTVGHNDRIYTGGGQNSHLLTTSPSKTVFAPHSYEGHFSEDDSQQGHDLKWKEEERDIAAPLPPNFRPNRRRGTDIELGGFDTLTESNLSVHNLRISNLNPLVHNFTSPISQSPGSFHF
jgi:hypothetical protein